jgi:DNA-binding ferritin-like protein (Dps family)|tara:strand:+ start:1963 stop:2175 length:213 start_codon:yes stop_codon:yes gene_type:complete
MIELNLRVFDDLLRIEKERNLAMKEVSDSLGIDITFSDDEIMNNAMRAYEEYINRELTKEVEGWMKSLFS